ncbi:class I SAM-dependent methyltransferase [Tianweitania sp.]|uniref:class I SAM-dependent methyltransferase n=1 Tax=Tianweitania sp. TaxID=2021634 RepID=UPI00289EC828|nr:class I SAM-dependent methyltransferase [Tianweitania sp.]
MSEALAEPRRDIDAILASIRAELGTVEPPAAQADRRALSVVRVESLDEGDEVFPSERKQFALEDFEGMDELAFLRAAYRAVLGRDIDESGLSHYLPVLREGHTGPADVLRSLRASPEGQARGVQIADLDGRSRYGRIKSLPIIGGILVRLKPYLSLPHGQRRLQRRIASSDRRQREVVTAVNTSLSSVRRSLQKLEQRVIEAEQAADQAHALTQEVIDSRDNAVSELTSARRQLVEQQRQLTTFIDSARGALPAASLQAPLLQSAEDASLDSLYVAFENRFRGSTDLISQRLRRYLDLTRETPPVAAGGTVLDIGCGRGEWLALLRDANVIARGIDLNGAMAAEARGRGLDARQGDAIAHLRGLEEGSLAAVTGFHIVEHLAFRDLVALFDAAYAALAPEGFALFETPNPENLVVGACTFHYDPTHNKPLPPNFLRFIAETRGFSDVRVIRRDEDCRLDQPESGFAPAELNDWFRQPADYAIYARKPRLDAAS